VQGLEGLWQWSGTGTRASLALAASQKILHMCVLARWAVCWRVAGALPVPGTAELAPSACRAEIMHGPVGVLLHLVLSNDQMNKCS
jgi:hypothetical protein